MLPDSRRRQRAEHYEMAAYGTLVAWARAMGHTEAADLLQETLDEEKAADEKLSSLAEGASTKRRPTQPILTKTRMKPAAVGAGAKRSASKARSKSRR
jgi:hypothetical protein